MSTYEITYFRNFHDTSVAVSDTVTLEDLVSVFSTHETSEDKDGMMFNLCTFIDKDGIRCTNNVDCYNGLILDYDGSGATIPMMVERFIGFTHIGYTSFRHAITGVDKFRIIFPFATPCPRNEWELRKQNFLEFAGVEIDRSCISHSRSFYMPACPGAGVEFADRWVCEGDMLDWQRFTPTPKPVYIPPAVVVPLTITDLQKALDELYKHRPVLPNEERYWLVRAIAREIGPEQAIVEARSRWSDATYNGKYEDQVKRLTVSGPGIGKIVKEIRKYNPAYTTTSKLGYAIAVLTAKLEKLNNKRKMK